MMISNNAIRPIRSKDINLKARVTNQRTKKPNGTK